MQHSVTVLQGAENGIATRPSRPTSGCAPQRTGGRAYICAPVFTAALLPQPEVETAGVPPHRDGQTGCGGSATESLSAFERNEVPVLAALSTASIAWRWREPAAAEGQAGLTPLT